MRVSEVVLLFGGDDEQVVHCTTVNAIKFCVYLSTRVSPAATREKTRTHPLRLVRFDTSVNGI